MKRPAWMSAWLLVATAAVTPLAAAQGPPPSDEAPALFEGLDRPTSKSDAYRVVGKVVEIDRTAGVVKLQSEEGVVTAKPRPELLRAARVGDTISVPRAEQSIPSASPHLR